ncbi:MAG: tetratricopeptide repeat protein [Sphingobacteriales bacterium]|nr:MAG: tetratricopeptide repeat protein [Sphingobacteriales bacterium]
MINKLYILIFFTLIFTTTHAEEHAFLQLGKMYYQQRNYNKALEQFSKYTKEFSKDAEGFYWRGITYIQLNEGLFAQGNLEEALKLNNKMDKAYNALGHLYNTRGEYQKAIHYLNKAIEINDKNAEAFNNRGMSYYNLDNFLSARKDFSTAISLDSTFAIAYNNRGSATYSHQDIAEATKQDLLNAEADFVKSIYYDNNNPLAYRNLAYVRYYLEKYTEAFFDINRTLDLSPNDAFSYRISGLIYAKVGKTNEAIVAYNKAIELKNYYADFYFERGVCLMNNKQYVDAEADFKQTIIIDKEQNLKGKAYYYLAQNAAYQDNLNECLSYLKLANKQKLFLKNSFLVDFNKNEVFKKYQNEATFTELATLIKYGKK